MTTSALMPILRKFTMVGMLSAPALLVGQPAAAPAPESLTKEGVIKGEMDIVFATRTQLSTTNDFVEGSANPGVKDTYKFNFRVVDTTEFAGSITRLPDLFGRTLRQKRQSAELAYDVTLSVLNPNDLKQKRTVGKWVGLAPIETETGTYLLDGGSKQERPLRVSVDAIGRQAAFTDPFGGRLQGKAEKKEGLANYTYKRLVNGKQVNYVAKKVDPMRFDGVMLAKGPAEIYPRTTVRGRLDYDYETGNWLTDGIRFSYVLNGQPVEDVITGSIKYVEDDDRANNGKSAYEFNLRFNEDKNKPPTTESAAFANTSGEDAFFVVDDTIPCLTGKIDYVDTFIAGSEQTPSASKVVYSLNSNKLTKQQIVNFFKLWMLCIGPTNDE